MTALTVAGLTAAAALILTLAARSIARDGGDDEHHGATEAYAKQLHDLTDATEEMAAIAAEVPDELAPRRGRHYHDTVEIVAHNYRPVLNADLARALYGKAVRA